MERLLGMIDDEIQSTYTQMIDIEHGEEYIHADSRSTLRLENELRKYPRLVEAYMNMRDDIGRTDVDSNRYYMLLLRFRRYVRNHPEYEKVSFDPIPSFHFKGDKSRSIKHAPRRKRSSSV